VQEWVGMRDTPRETAFERCALVSGLLTREQIDEARAAIRASPQGWPAARFAPNDEQLAKKVVELGMLNLWQAQQFLAGRTKFNLGPYWIVDSIGHGGMGQVFKGEHGLLGRVVAIKVLPRYKSTPEAIASFTREIRAQAQLNHENLVRAFDAGEDGNVYYLVTEYVPGTDLRKMVRQHGPLSMEAAASILSQVAAGLQHAHEQGLIHRDVKPGNVLVTPDGHAKLSDLGLAGSLAGDVRKDPQFGKIVGTADYLSPDHIESPWNPTPAWDIYSLGCTLYYAVSGKVPFPGGTTADKARAHCQLRPLDPRRLNPSLSAEFVEVLADMMAKNPAERIQSAAEVVERLKPWAQTAWLPPAERKSRAAGQSGIGSLSKSLRTGASSVGAGELQMKDTVASFPDMHEAASTPKESPSDVSQSTHPVASGAEETGSSVLSMAGTGPRKRVSVLRPLAFFLLLPAALVGAVTLIWAVAKLLQ